MSVDPAGRAVLTITDHLPWDYENHLQVLQEKLNKYLAFVESGEVYDKYPESKNREFLFKVSCKFAPDSQALDFFKKVKTIIERAGFEFQQTVFAASYEN